MKEDIIYFENDDCNGDIFRMKQEIARLKANVSDLRNENKKLRNENEVLENMLKFQNIKNKKIYQVEIHEMCEDEEQSELTGIKTIIDKYHVFTCFCYEYYEDEYNDYFDFIDTNYKTITYTSLKGSSGTGIYLLKINGKTFYQCDKED
jgi:regulator of replication initiation timing